MTDLERERHFLRGDITELLEEMPTLHLLPVHAQQAWHARKVRIAERLVLLHAEDEAARVLSF